jgi:uncharacterized protein YjaZ
MHAGKAGNILKIPLVNITVYPNKNFVIPETGDGGYTPSKDWFHIYIDPQRKDFNKIVKNVIPATIYHEMNHAARWKYTGYGTNLLEVIITEGLATVFAEEQWIKFKAPWADCSEAEINTLLNIVRKREKKNDITYSHGEWFYGTGKLPRWIGYKVGSYVIKSYRSKNKSIKWNQLIKMNANDIIRLSRINLK